MIWQDIVLTIGQWIFIIALLPSIFGKNKPALFTSLVTGLVAAIYAVTFATLSLWVSAISTVFLTAAWFILAVQKYFIEKPQTKNKGVGTLQNGRGKN